MSNKGKNPNSQKNLKPIKKGEVRNPKGKIPGTLNFTTYLKAALDSQIKRIDPVSKREEKKAIRAAIAATHLRLALDGDLPAIKELYDRVDGKVPQKSELTGADGGAIKTEEVNPLSKLSPEKISELLKKSNARY